MTLHMKSNAEKVNCQDDDNNTVALKTLVEGGPLINKLIVKK